MASYRMSDPLISQPTTKKLYSYIVANDTGFAPNPFGKYCTLATCKPAIRSTAKIGDWVVGLSPRAKGNKLIYAMLVAETLPFAAYFHDRRFSGKIPACGPASINCQCGDNIYEPLPTGGYQQLQSRHSGPDPKKAKKHKDRDLGGKNVLIASQFYYFGSRALDLPVHLHELVVGRGHKTRFSKALILEFERFIFRQQPGRHGAPADKNQACPHRAR
jgi:hypothetical protein